MRKYKKGKITYNELNEFSFNYKDKICQMKKESWEKCIPNIDNAKDMS